MEEARESDNSETPDRAVASAGCTATGGYSSLLPKSFYDKRWFKAASVLRNDPSLMTSKLLIVALKNKAPLHVIKFFLGVNPKSAGIPKEGPTPLQVAVQYNASKEVIKELLQVCPFALVVTTSADWLDPLTYARRYRTSEDELIALLSRPLGSWIHPKEREEADRKASQVKAPAAPPAIQIASNPPAPPRASVPVSLPKATTNRYRAPKEERTSRLSTVEKQELQNVKQLCLQVMKGQKRLVREVGIVKNAVQNAPVVGNEIKESVARKTSSEEPEITAKDMRDLEEKQKRNLKAHLIALDMKEQAMRAYVARMEEKILQSLEVTQQEHLTERYEDAFNNMRDQLNRSVRRVDSFVGSIENRVSDCEVRAKQEAKVNAHFRSGLQNHFGIQEDVSRQEDLEIISVVENTPLVFSTPYRKPTRDEEVPLCPKEAPQEEKVPGSCLWPKFLSKRHSNRSSLT